MAEFYSIDFETSLIQPGLVAPPPVVLTWADGENCGLVPSSDGWRHIKDWLKAHLTHGNFTGFNIAFDFAVTLAWFPELTELVFEAYEDGRVHEIGIAERLGEIATGMPDKHPSLARLASLYHVAELDKANSPRLDYARYMFKSELPEAHRKYAIDDAVTGHELYRRVRGRYGDLITDDAIASESRHAFWLQLCSAWGLRVNPDRLEDLKRSTLERQAALLEIAQEVGFVREDGSKNVARIQQYVAGCYGVPWRFVKKSENKRTCWLSWEVAGKIPEAIMTEAGKISTSKTILLDSDDPLLQDFAEWGEVSAALNKDVPMLDAGTRAPIHTKYGLAGTTRVTSSRGATAGGNFNNFGRKGGARECLEPREDCCYGEADVGGLELGTLGQVIKWTTGRTALIEKLNAGIDVHLEAACEALGIDYATADKEEKHIKLIRQFKKIPNFGYPGGMGAETLVYFGRQQLEREKFQKLFGKNAEEALATALREKEAWERANPETVEYLRHYVRTCKNEDGLYDFYIPGSPGFVPPIEGGRSGILRANVHYCSAANGPFQGLGAQATKQIGWELTREAWLDRSSPLHVDKGARLSSYVYDSFFYEMPIGTQHDVMMRVRDAMIAGLKRALPDLKMSVDPLAMAVWSKDAKAVYGKDGRLGIWEPKS